MVVAALAPEVFSAWVCIHAAMPGGFKIYGVVGTQKYGLFDSIQSTCHFTAEETEAQRGDMISSEFTHQKKGSAGTTAQVSTY